MPILEGNSPEDRMQVTFVESLLSFVTYLAQHIDNERSRNLVGLYGAWIRALRVEQRSIMIAGQLPVPRAGCKDTLHMSHNAVNGYI